MNNFDLFINERNIVAETGEEKSWKIYDVNVVNLRRTSFSPQPAALAWLKYRNFIFFVPRQLLS